MADINLGPAVELLWWILVFAIAALGVNLMIGQTGMFYLGQVGFMIIGGACSMIVTSDQWHRVFPALSGVSTFAAGALLGMVVSALIALGIGYPTLRLRGDYFAIATLGFAAVVKIIFNANPFRKLHPDAETLLVTMPPVDVLGARLSGAGELAFVAALFAIVFAITLRLVYSPFGRLLRAARDDELGTMSLGKDVFRLRLKAFLFAAMLGSLAGSLYVHHALAFAADQLGGGDPYGITFTVYLLLIVILGGSGSSLGVLFGAVAIGVLNNAPRWIQDALIANGAITLEQAATIDWGGWGLVMFAVLVIAVMLVYPHGLLGEGGRLGMYVERLRDRVILTFRSRRPPGGRPAPSLGPPPPPQVELPPPPPGEAAVHRAGPPLPPPPGGD